MTEHRKQKLWFFMLGLILFGLFVIGRVFVSASKHPGNAGKDLIRFDPSALRVDQLTVLDRGDEGDVKVKFIVLKTGDGIKVFSILANENELFMPGMRDWVLPGSGTCARLSASNGEIFCAVPRLSADNAALWHWDYDGKNIPGKIANLKKVDFNDDGDVITIGKK